MDNAEHWELALEMVVGLLRKLKEKHDLDNFGYEELKTLELATKVLKNVPSDKGGSRFVATTDTRMKAISVDELLTHVRADE